MSLPPLPVAAEDTRERILAGAAAVFADRGYQQARLDDIAARAGLTKGAIYWHFRNKADLFCALVEARLQANTAPLSADLAEALRADSDSRQQQLARLLRDTLARFRADAHWPRLFLEFLSQSRDPAVAERLRQLYQNGQRIAAEVVRCLKQAGLTDADLDTEVLALFWTAFIDGLMLSWVVDPSRWDDERLVARLVEVLWRGLQPPPTGRGA